MVHNTVFPIELQSIDSPMLWYIEAQKPLIAPQIDSELLCSGVFIFAE